MGSDPIYSDERARGLVVRLRSLRELRRDTKPDVSPQAEADRLRNRTFFGPTGAFRPDFCGTYFGLAGEGVALVTGLRLGRRWPRRNPFSFTTQARPFLRAQVGSRRFS